MKFSINNWKTTRFLLELSDSNTIDRQKFRNIIRWYFQTVKEQGEIEVSLLAYGYINKSVDENYSLSEKTLREIASTGAILEKLTTLVKGQLEEIGLTAKGGRYGCYYIYDGIYTFQFNPILREEQVFLKISFPSVDQWVLPPVVNTILLPQSAVEDTSIITRLTESFLEAIKIVKKRREKT